MKDKIAGKAKVIQGKATGSKSKQSEGKTQGAVGGVKQDAREVKDKLKGRK